MNRTSISDFGQYPYFCYMASRDDNIFKNFKRYDVYREVLEHTTPEQGLEYIKEIKKSVSFTKDQWENFLKNDTVGNPLVASFKLPETTQGGGVSPGTLRYIKVLSDIIKLFDTENIKTVAEIGVGYGGQCRIMTEYLKIEEYTLFDLPEVLELTERFLTTLEAKGNIRYINGKHIYATDSYDFAISNYAFSELIRPVQDMYLEKVLLKAERGYITWNGAITPKWGLECYSLDEILKILPNPKVIPEVPLTAPDNCIVIWGNK